MAHECTILFGHYRDDDVTRQNLAVLRRFNPKYPVIPISFLPTAIDGCVAVGGDDVPDPWREADLLIYRWFAKRSSKAKRYVYLEWDTLMTQPVREYYAEVWNAHAACKTRASFPADDWYWFTEVHRLPPAMRRYATGVYPLNGLLFSRRALKSICSRKPPADVYCELRVGTLLSHAGIDIRELPQNKAATNHWLPTMTQFDPAKPSLYHPVKTLVPLPAMPEVG